MKKLILLLAVIAIHISNISAQKPDSPVLENPPNSVDVVVLPAVLDWANVPTADGYYIHISTEANTPPGIPTVMATSSKYTIAEGSLEANTTYYWRVWAHNHDGWSIGSATYSFKTASTTDIGSVKNLSDGVIDLIAEQDISPVQGNQLVNRLNEVGRRVENNQPILALANMVLFKARLIVLRISNQISAVTYNNLNYSTDGVIDLIADLDRPGSPITTLEEALTPKSYNLMQNYPNPFNPSTTIEYSIPSGSFVSLKIYDMAGKEVSTLVSKQQELGTYIVDWNASNLSSGVYFYRLNAGNFTETKKMILAK